MKKQHQDAAEDRLQGWREIARFLGQPLATAQHWARTGMPVKREGRYTVASREELSKWLGKESGLGEAAHIPAKGDDLAAQLKRGLQKFKKRGKR